MIRSPVAILLGGFGVGLVLTNLFMIGHDAAHGSFTSSERFNRVIAWACMTLSYHPVSAWRHIHHDVHHRLANDRRGDVVWRPLDLETYRAATLTARAWHRCCRSSAGLGLYYLVEHWGRELMGAKSSATPPASVWPGRVTPLLAMATAGVVGWRANGCMAALCLTIVPLGVLSTVIGFVVYFNHTHPTVPWFVGAADWTRGSNQYRCTVRLVYPQPLAHFLGNIMEHTAHHVHPGVPLVNLRKAQARLQDVLEDAVVEQRWSPRTHRAIVRTCRLYDSDQHVWLDWTGEPLAATTLASPEDRARFGFWLRDLPGPRPVTHPTIDVSTRTDAFNARCTRSAQGR